MKIKSQSLKSRHRNKRIFECLLKGFGIRDLVLFHVNPGRSRAFFYKIIHCAIRYSLEIDRVEAEAYLPAVGLYFLLVSQKCPLDLVEVNDLDN